jgi:hypothetical protein
MLGICLGARFAKGKWKTLSLVQEDQLPDIDPLDDIMPDPTMGAV